MLFTNIKDSAKIAFVTTGEYSGTGAHVMNMTKREFIASLRGTDSDSILSDDETWILLEQWEENNGDGADYEVMLTVDPKTGNIVEVRV